MRRLLTLLLVLLISPTLATYAQTDESCGPKSGLCWTRLKQGASGEKVRNLQALLNNRGFTLAIDGQFGSSTKNSVRSFQKQKKLTVDGVVGSQTWERLVPTLKSGARGKDVSLLQTLLGKRQYPARTDGIFGNQTRSAVKALQKDIALVDADGVADDAEWCYLLGGHIDGE